MASGVTSGVASGVSRGFGISAKECLFVEIVPTSLYGVEVFPSLPGGVEYEKCGQKWRISLVGVSRKDKVRNEELRRRIGIERELSSSADQRVSTDLDTWRK